MKWTIEKLEATPFSKMKRLGLGSILREGDFYTAPCHDQLTFERRVKYFVHPDNFGKILSNVSYLSFYRPPAHKKIVG